MSSVQKRLNNFLYAASAEDRSRQFAHVTMALMMSILIISVLSEPIVMNTLSKRIDFTMIDEILEPKEPPKNKKFEVYFTDESEFVYQILKPKPVIEPKIEKPKDPPPPPPKPKPKPKPKPQPVVKPKVVTPPEVVAPPVQAVSNQSEFATTEEPGASGDQVLATLLGAVNEYKVYPRRAQRQGVQGKNFLNVSINPEGKVTEAKLAKAMGYATLDNASEKLAKDLIGLQLPAPKKNMNVTIPIEYSFAN